MLYCLNPACSHPHNPDTNSTCQACGFPLKSLDHEYLFQNRYLISQFLGEEGLKKCYLAQDTQQMDELRVIKKYSLSGSDLSLPEVQKKVHHTFAELSQLNHPQVAKIFDYFIEDNNIYSIEEYVDGHDLLTEIKEKNTLDDTEITVILRELLPVLSYLHRKNIVHGKINLKNIIRPVFFLPLNPEEETPTGETSGLDVTPVANVVSSSDTTQNASSNKVYYIADPWLDGNSNNPQFRLTGTTENLELPERELDSPQNDKTLELPEKELDSPQNDKTIDEIVEKLEETYQNTALESPHSTLGRGKKLVLMNVEEGLLFSDFIREPDCSPLLPTKDIYDLGVICIHLLTGYLPQAEQSEKPIDSLYDDETKRWLWRDVMARQHRIISRDLTFILDKMLSSSRLEESLAPATEGYQTATEVIKDLYSDAPLEYLTIPEDKARLKRRGFLKLAGLGTLGLVTAVGIDRWRRGANWENSLQPFNFEVPEVNSQGQVIKRQPKQAQAVAVNLGNGVKMEFVAIPGGEFLIGSPNTERDRNANESPQKKIRISPFFMSKYPVTQAQWDAVMGKNISLFKGPNRPVEKVSWSDCVEFCQKLAKKVNRDCRLPSEAEWEYACRAGTTTAFAYGVTITPELANYNGQYTYLSEPKGVNRQQTTNVGSFPPNAFGLYDMHGLVWEWCADNWYDNYSHIPIDGKPFIDKGIYRVLRGGAWLNEPYFCRSANRNSDIANVRFYSFGCRVAVSATRNLVFS